VSGPVEQLHCEEAQVSRGGGRALIRLGKLDTTQARVGIEIPVNEYNNKNGTDKKHNIRVQYNPAEYKINKRSE
jgi:hypothetical protein